jgi:hypothetical protein
VFGTELVLHLRDIRNLHWLQLGIANPLPDFTTLKFVFPKIFQRFMLRSLVSILRQLPCGISQGVSLISSSTSMLRRGSNSRVCEYNSEK